MDKELDIQIRRDAAGWHWEMTVDGAAARSHERFGQASEAIGAASRFLAHVEARRAAAKARAA